MNFKQYSPLAMRTAKPLPKKQQVLHALIGLSGEVGELADAIKKNVIYGKALDKVNVMEECSDIFWYLQLYMDESEVSLSVVDRAAADISEQSGTLQSLVDKDPFALVEISLAISSLVAALSVTEADRGAPDKLVIFNLGLMLCGLLEFCGYTLSQALETNINKLAARYGDKYSDYDALNRDLVGERVVLENADVKLH